MINTAGVTLQINLAPTDLPHAKYILPHQLRQWAGQVDEVLLIVDLHRSRGRFGEGWAERLPGLRALIEECCAKYTHVRALDVDYSAEVGASVSSFFLVESRFLPKIGMGVLFIPIFLAYGLQSMIMFFIWTRI